MGCCSAIKVPDAGLAFFPDESPPDQCKAIIKKKAGRDSSLVVGSVPFFKSIKNIKKSSVVMLSFPQCCGTSVTKHRFRRNRQNLLLRSVSHYHAIFITHNSKVITFISIFLRSSSHQTENVSTFSIKLSQSGELCVTLKKSQLLV